MASINVYPQEWIEDRSQTKAGINEHTFCGVFQTKANVNRKKIVDYELHMLDEWEQQFFSIVPVDPTEKLFRIKTDNVRLANMKPLIKINFEKELIHFIQHRDDEQVRFERGVKFEFLNISEHAVLDVEIPY